MAAGLGCLQIVLDKGQREDWFSSQLDHLDELYRRILSDYFYPSRIFYRKPYGQSKNLQESFIQFRKSYHVFHLFQSLRQYCLTSDLPPDVDGIYFLPRRTGTGTRRHCHMIAMLIAGKLITRVNPKAILAFGIIIAAYSVHLMSILISLADFSAIFWPRSCGVWAWVSSSFL